MTSLPTASPLAQDASEVHPEINLWDRSQPRAVLNLLPEKFAELAEEAKFLREEWFGPDERTLHQTLKLDNRMPSATDHRLRHRFWMEYDQAQLEMRDMVVTRVTGGVIPADYLYTKYLKEPSKIAWLLCPPTEYKIKTAEALEFGLEQLRDILAEDHVKAGKFDSRLAEIKLKIVQMLDSRVKGAITQRVLSVNANVSDRAIAKKIHSEIEGNSIEALDKRLKELRKRNEKELNGGLIGRSSDEEAIEVSSRAVGEAGQGEGPPDDSPA